MCFKDRLVYQCGHTHFPVIRPCPQVTEDPRSPICTIQSSNEFMQATMCVTCEKLLHNRWVLVQEALHRFDHERGICGCPVIFPNLRCRPRLITSGDHDTDSSKQQLPNPPVPVHGPMVLSSQRQPENSPDSQVRNNASTRNDDWEVPEIYREGTNSDGTRKVDVRIAGLYAAEWLKDHGHLHETGQCHCAATFEPVPDPEEAELNADERSLLALHRQVMANPPPAQVLYQMQQQTGAPMLGMAHNHIRVTTHGPPGPGHDLYPANLGPGVFQPDANTVVFGHNIDPATVTGFSPAGPPPPYFPAPAYGYFPVEIPGSGMDGYLPDPPQGSSTPRGHGQARGGQRGNRGGRGGGSGRNRGRNGRGGAGRNNTIIGHETTARTARHELYRQQFGNNMQNTRAQPVSVARRDPPGSPAGHTERSFPTIERNVTPAQLAEGATSGAPA